MFSDVIKRNVAIKSVEAQKKGKVFIYEEKKKKTAEANKKNKYTNKKQKIQGKAKEKHPIKLIRANKKRLRISARAEKVTQSKPQEGAQVGR